MRAKTPVDAVGQAGFMARRIADWSEILGGLVGFFIDFG